MNDWEIALNQRQRQVLLLDPAVDDIFIYPCRVMFTREDYQEHAPGGGRFNCFDLIVSVRSVIHDFYPTYSFLGFQANEPPPFHQIGDKALVLMYYGKRGDKEITWPMAMCDMDTGRINIDESYLCYHMMRKVSRSWAGNVLHKAGRQLTRSLDLRGDAQRNATKDQRDLIRYLAMELPDRRVLFQKDFS